MQQRKLIIAEKSSVATELAKVIALDSSNFENKKTYLENHQFIITWCVGHLVRLSMPDAYGVKSWSLDTLPFLPEAFKLEINEATREQFGTIKALMHRHDVSEIINACDAGREGELIFRLIYDYVDCKKPYRRLWITSYENHVIKDGMDNLLDGFEMERLYDAGLCRQRADYLVGINATRLMTKKYETTLNVGRVQSPTLNLICVRDDQIANFVPESNYPVQLTFKDFTAKYVPAPEEKVTRALAEKIKNHCTNQDAVVTLIDQKEKKKNPEPLFSLTQLQKKANQYFGYPAKRTLEIAQRLYSPAFKMLTYPRTDSSFLSSSQEAMFTKLIDDLLKSRKLVLQGSFDRGVANIHLVINDSEVTDHHAILLTEESFKRDWSVLKVEERNILYLVAYQMLLAISPALHFETTNVMLQVDEYHFLATGNILINGGFRKLERISKGFLGIKQRNRNITTLPSLSEGEILKVLEAIVLESETSSPPHYTESTLLGAMEKGLGTPATRAEIIELLVSRGYVVRDKNKLIATKKAHQLMLILPDELKTLELTLMWEEKLNQMALGLTHTDEFINEIKRFVAEFVSREKEKPRLLEFKSELDSKEGYEIIGECPKCKGKVIEHKRGINYHCSNHQCKFVLWKDDKYFSTFGKKITKSRAKSLLEKGFVKVSVTNRTGNKCDAIVTLEVNSVYDRASFRLQYTKD